MNRKIEMAAMDVDGTILGKNKVLTERTRQALKKAAGCGAHLVIASGRALEAIPGELRDLDGVEYAITSNGSSIFRISDGKRVYRKDLTSDQVECIMELYEEFGCPIEIFIHGRAYTSADYFNEPEKFGAGPSSALYVRTTRHPVEDIRLFAAAHRDVIEGINFIVYNQLKKCEMRRRLESFGDFYVTSSVARYIEVSHRDVCKRNALIWLAEYLNIPRENIAAFGDGENDLEMIEYAGIGVAMENGISVLKDKADLTAPPCEEDGVARVLEMLFEKERFINERIK